MPRRTEASALGVWEAGRSGRERRLVFRPWPPEDQAERPADLGGLCWRLSLASDGHGTSSRRRRGRLDLPHQKLPTSLVLSGRQGKRPPVGGELDGQLGQLLFEPAALAEPGWASARSYLSGHRRCAAQQSIASRGWVALLRLPLMGVGQLGPASGPRSVRLEIVNRDTRG